MSFCLFFFSHCNQTWLLHFQQRMIQIRQIQTFNSLNVDSLMGSTSSLRDGSFFVNLKRTVYFCELSLKHNKRIGNKRVKLYQKLSDPVECNFIDALISMKDRGRISP